ncbi:MAG: flagellar export protein FliJ [Sedimentisphaerales bacterium]
MKKFVWRAQKVLEVKKIEEQRKKNELLAITENLTNAVGLLIAKKALLKDMLEQLNTKDPMKNLQQRQIFFRYSAINDEAIEHLKRKIAELEKQQKEKIAEFLKIRQYSQGLEKLREQAKIRFYDEQEKLDQKQADEDTVMKYSRVKVSSQ